MRWFDKLERKIGHRAIKGLMMYVVVLNLAVYLLQILVPSGRLYSKLILMPSLVLKGEIWRLITYIFIPPSASPIFIIFVLYFYYIIGNSLEQEWGSFKFNLYYLIGMIGTTIAAFITGLGTTGTYLNLSLFLAFAQLYPDHELLLFFILPVKVKYLAWFNWAVIGFTLLFEPLPLKAAAVASIVNYFIFFSDDIRNDIKMRRLVRNNRKRFFKEINKYRK